MTKATITLDATARALLGDALLDMLGAEAQRLENVLVRCDRANHPQPAQLACRRIHRLARLLDTVGWGAAATGESMRIDPDRQLPLAITALRKALVYAEDNAKDSCAYGDTEQALRARMRLHQTRETLLRLQMQALLLRSGQ